MIKDSYGRTVTYVRISVTDRCNFRCQYCHPQKTWEFIPHENILTYEEILRLVRIFADMGVGKVRLTGGEPFARRDFVSFLREFRTRFPDMDLRLTTNGSLVGPHVPDLVDMGLRCLNISLDTWQRDKFARITGRDALQDVLDTIRACERHGLDYKLNVVAVRGFNDDEVEAFVGFARDHEVDVRFIEYMPIGGETLWGADTYWPSGEILDAMRRHADLVPALRQDHHPGPARMFQIAGSKGRVGVISAVSCHFCATCNRLRVTAEGNLRTCLFSDRTYRLRPALRSPSLDDKAVQKIIHAANASKPLGYKLLENRRDQNGVCRTTMSSIGG